MALAMTTLFFCKLFRKLRLFISTMFITQVSDAINSQLTSDRVTDVWLEKNTSKYHNAAL